MDKALEILLKHFEKEVEMNVTDKNDQHAYWGEVEDYWEKNILYKGMIAMFFDYMAYKTFGIPMYKDNIFLELEDD